jgi:hypothetical protein
MLEPKLNSNDTLLTDQVVQQLWVVLCDEVTPVMDLFLLQMNFDFNIMAWKNSLSMANVDMMLVSKQ